MATVFETVRSAADELRAAGVDTPQHDAKLLLAEAFHTDLQHVDKAMLMGDGVERLAEKEDAEPAMERFQTMLARRVKREPLQHITGHAVDFTAPGYGRPADVVRAIVAGNDVLVFSNNPGAAKNAPGFVPRYDMGQHAATLVREAIALCPKRCISAEGWEEEDY